MPDFNEFQTENKTSDNTPLPPGLYAVEISVDRNNTLEQPENMDVFNGEFIPNFFRKSGASPLHYFALCFTVVSPDFSTRKFWKNMNVYGAPLSEGQQKSVTFSNLIVRRLIESHYGLEHDDVSEKAKNLRKCSYNELEGMNAVIDVEIEPNAEYGDKNTFNPWQGVITADDPRYAEYAQYFTNKVVDTSTKTFEKKAEVVKPTGNTATAASKAADFGI